MTRISWKSAAIQVAVVVLLTAGIGWLISNTQQNLTSRGLSFGYDFFLEAAGFSITDGPVAYQVGDSYLKAFLAGAANTLVAAIPALLFITIFGLMLGIASISNNRLLKALIQAYVDAARNVPLLVHVLLWYTTLTNILPDNSAPIQILDFYLSKSGLAIPHPITGDLPVMGTFGLQGGLHISPELTALVLALSVYTSAYCSELVRAGLLSVTKGQWEAAHALGLSRMQAIRLIIIPQAMRVIMPPYISLALNTIKNSSLGVAIGYPEIVSIGTTSLNQSGRAIECISIIALIYLILNLLTSMILSIYNKRVQIRER
jgi:general L-amino acid transport system permease protein